MSTTIKVVATDEVDCECDICDRGDDYSEIAKAIWREAGHQGEATWSALAGLTEIASGKIGVALAKGTE